jgi:hypothetical protein
MSATMDEIQDQLQDLFTTVKFSAEDYHVVAMHLTEIEDEVLNFLDELSDFRAHARHLDPVAAQLALVEISVALHHIANHIPAVTAILNQELGIDVDDVA